MPHAETPSTPELVRAVRRALDGGPAVVPLPRVTSGALPPGTALVVRTSGSTGAPREVALGADALRASATATHERLGGPGRWVLTLPPTHVAGMQVLVRSVLAGAPPVVPGASAGDSSAGGGFTPDGLADLLEPALREAGDAPLYLSLVPTQLHRVVAAASDGAGRGLRALARCAGVLVGGAASSPALLARAREGGVRVVTTYGMSETAGGCVYDGAPLRDVRVRLASPDLSEPRQALAGPGSDNSGGAGVIELGGPTLALGYVGDDAATDAAFRTGPDGDRWFRTSDLGRLDDETLRVLGRADDVVVTGGENVAPAPVEALLGELLGGEACVVGVPDPEWGHAVVALVTTPSATSVLTSSSSPRLEDPISTHVAGWGRLDDAELARVRAAVATRLGPPSAPRRVYRVPALPLRGPGKVDRRGVVALVREHEARD